MSDLLPPHGGYRTLRSIQVAQLAHDVTVRFCDKYIDRYSRTRDQMIQTARSGVQNIAEGSVASGTSKKTELRLTQVARASLEELRVDYEDFLRQRRLPEWGREDPLRQELVDSRPQNADQVAEWVRSEAGDRVDLHPVCSANAARVLVIVAGYLLDQQIRKLARDFEESGYTERLSRVRRKRRPKP